ncbi:hypothetical protein ACHAW6_009598 [Cyclotella cf. meneghiniana]
MFHLVGNIHRCIDKIEISNIDLETPPIEIYDTLLFWFNIKLVRLERRLDRRVFYIRIRGFDQDIERLVNQYQLPWHFSLSAESVRLRFDCQMPYAHLINRKVYRGFIPHDHGHIQNSNSNFRSNNNNSIGVSSGTSSRLSRATLDMSSKASGGATTTASIGATREYSSQASRGVTGLHQLELRVNIRASGGVTTTASIGATFDSSRNASGGTTGTASASPHSTTKNTTTSNIADGKASPAFLISARKLTPKSLGISAFYRSSKSIRASTSQKNRIHPRHNNTPDISDVRLRCYFITKFLHLEHQMKEIMQEKVLCK